MKFSRRDVIAHLRNIISTAGAYPLIASPLIAQNSSPADSQDEHFFIFVELKGGVHHTVTTDYPSIDAIKKIEQEKSRAVTTFPLRDDYESFLNGTLFGEAEKNSQLSETQQQRLFEDIKFFQNSLLADSIMLNGYFCALPYDAAKKDNYYYQSPDNSNIRLGPAALSLAEHVAKMSVLRGVFMRGTFHGLANEEIYSGSSDRKGSHVAGALARLLEKKYGTKPLDNLVLGSASYVTANEGDLKTAVQVPFATIRALAEKSEGNVDLPLSHAETIARAMQNKYGLGNKQRAILDEYLASFNDAERAKQNLQRLMQEKNFATNSSDGRPIRLSLGVQLDACLSLIKSGMSRVLTICVGQGDGFGGFDSHQNYYHDFRSTDDYQSDNMSFFKLTELTMDDLAAFIKKIETEDYKDGMKWKDVLTVVVSSEFGRSNNFSGSDDRTGQFGNDHYYFNNNYIFFGKNVQAGQWLGASDPITRYPHVVDFCKLNNGDIENAFENPLQVVDIDASNKGLGQKITLKEGYLSGDMQITMDTDMQSSDPLRSTQQSDGTCSYRTKRALMAKDVMRTIMAIAGFESDFSSYYVDDFYKDAQVIAALLKK